MTWTCETVLGKLPESEFLEKVLGQHCIYIKGDAARFADALSWEDINCLFDRCSVNPEKIEISVSGEQISPDRYLRATELGRHVAGAREIDNFLGTGAILSISGVEQLDLSIASLCESWERLLNIPVTADLCVSMKCGSTGAAKANAHDTIVIQIHGSTEWRLYQSPESSAPGAPIIARAGDILYVTSGRPAEMVTGTGPGAYLALVFRNPTGVDLLTRLFDQLAASEFMRSFCPRFGTAETQAQYLTQLQTEITEACCEPGLMLGALADMRTVAHSRTGFSFPLVYIDDLSSLSTEIVIQDTSRFRDQYTVPDSEAERGCEIAHNGQKIALQPGATAILRVILEVNRTTIGELKAQVKLSEPDFSESLRFLLRNGLVSAVTSTIPSS